MCARKRDVLLCSLLFIGIYLAENINEIANVLGVLTQPLLFQESILKPDLGREISEIFSAFGGTIENVTLSRSECFVEEKGRVPQPRKTVNSPASSDHHHRGDDLDLGCCRNVETAVEPPFVGQSSICGGELTRQGSIRLHISAC